MLSVSRFGTQSPPSFGRHCGELPPLVHERHFGWNSLEANPSKSPTTPEGYPSPPMSGSPPSSVAAPHDASSSSHPAYASRVPSEELPQSWREEHHDPRRPSATSSVSQFSDHSYYMRNQQYSHPPSQQNVNYVPQYNTANIPEQSTHLYTPSSTPASASASLAVTGSSATADLPRITSPKAQRKAKGHVASACKPCKKAHLRCDAQRPCLRCSKNGKESDCVDVQHKKRGRPRLPKEDPLKFQNMHELTARKPSSMYQPETIRPIGYDHGSRQRHRLRSVDYGQRIASSPAHLERFVAGRPEYPVQPSLETVAYLNMNMEFVKVSPAFSDAISSRSSIVGHRLADLVAKTDVDRISTLCNSFATEQKRREPNYLPPIFGTNDQALHNLSFSREAVSRIQLDVDEYFGFATPEGYLRSYPIRLGLFKSGSLYLIAAVINVPRATYPDMAGDSRTQQYALPPIPPVPTTLPQPPQAVQYDPAREGHGNERVYAPQALSQAVQTTSPPHSSYSPSPHRGEYISHPASQIPRSELPAPTSTMQQTSYQLPPIRAPEDVPPPQNDQRGTSRDQRPRRLTIGGLLDSPDAPRH